MKRTTFFVLFLFIAKLNASELYGPPYINPEVLNYCQAPHATTCNSSWGLKDPTGTVGSDVEGEIRAFRILRSVIRSNPNKTSKEVEEELVSRIYNKNRVSKISESFEIARGFVRQVLETQAPGVFSGEELAALVKRVNSVQLDLPLPAQKYADAADLFTKNQIYYQRTKDGVLRVRVGGAFLLNASSLYNLVFTNAHEIAHAIDPCEMHAINSVPKAYEGVVRCFQSNGWVPENAGRCGVDDRSSEVFADWIASQAIGLFMQEAIAAYEPEQKIAAAINATRDLCAQGLVRERSSYRVHQKPILRIEEVFAAQATIRQAIGCPQTMREMKTCSFVQTESIKSKEMTWSD